MIWHFFEVWLLFMVVFAAGCGLGASLYAGLARGPLAAAQGVVADSVGDAIDGIKWRLGVGPNWRPGYESAVENGGPGAGRQDTEEDHARPVVSAPPSWTDDPPAAHDERAGKADREEEGMEAGDVPEETADAGSVAASEESTAGPTIPEDTTMMRPAGLSAPRSGIADNLQRIRGVGRRNEEMLHSLGIFHFGQIAAWTPAEARWVGAHLAFPERIERDDWVGQAIVLASGGETGYVKSPDRRRRGEGDDGED